MNYILFSIGSAFFFALTFFIRRIATKSLSVTTAYALEAFVQLLILSIIFFLVSPELKKGLDFKNIGMKYVLMAGITVTIAVGLNFFAIKSGSVAKVIAITSPSQIMFGLLLGLLLAGDTFTLKQFIGVLFGIAGILLITL